MDDLMQRFNELSMIKKVPLVVFSGISARVFLAWLRRKLLRRPPQPFSFPLLGNLGYLPQPGEPGPGVHECMTKLGRKHGPVMGFWFGAKYTVVLSHWEAIHEALKLKGQAFAGRFCPPAINTITHGKGIALQNDLTKWKKARTCLLQGMTKKIGSDADNKAIPVMIEEIHSTGKDWYDLCQKNGGSWSGSVRAMVGRESLNVYMRQMCSLRYSNKLTETYQDVRLCLEEIFKRISAGNPADYIPILGLFGRPKILDEMTYWSDKMYGHIRSYLDEHRKTLDKANPRDFCDAMLIEQQAHGLDDQDVEVIMWDVMAGGIDTTATTLEWLFYILGNNPDTMKKVHEELDKIVGQDRLPKWEDRDNLPYLNAVLCELMRWKHFAPFGLPHMTLEDTEVGGYRIPAGAQVLVNFHASFMDPTSWKKPEEWRPERFLEEEKHLARGFLDGELQKTKEQYKFIPYGTGARMCVGWGIGRAVLWMKVATHLHCFKISCPSHIKQFKMSESFGVTLLPEDQEVQFTARAPAKLLKSIEDNLPKTVLKNL